MPYRFLVTGGLQRVQLTDLCRTNGGVVNRANLHSGLFIVFKAIHSYDHVATGVDARLPPSR